MSEILDRLANIEARLQALELAAARRRAASARANAVRAERALSRARKAAALGEQVGWRDSGRGRRLTDTAICELISTLLAAEGIRASCSSVRRDLLVRL